MLERTKRERDLAERMSAAALDAQKEGGHAPRFIRPWRIYADDNHSPRLSKEPVSCGSECGCGISPDVNVKQG
jgi:hypothetical protein